MTPRQQAGPVRLAFVLALILTAGGVAAFGQASNERTEKVYWVEKITEDGKIILREYEVTSTQILDFPDLEIWGKAFGRSDPFFMQRGKILDVKSLLLQTGLARLRDETTAASELQRAQNEAKTSGSGMWYKPAPRIVNSPSPNSSSANVPTTPVPSSTPIEPSLVDDAINTIKNWNWYRILRISIAIVGLIGLAELLKLFLLWRRRHRVPLVFVGLRATGKSWLWNRISDPEISEEELNKILPTDLMVKKKAPTKKPMGKYEITPVYFDIAGGQVGQQVTTLLDENRRFRTLRKLLIPQKWVWILMLATTQDKTAQRDTAEDKKIDRLFIREQLGHLNLPLGILSSKVTPKPEMVITCIGKFDLFADAKPDDTTAGEAKQKLQEIFREHISKTRQECQSMRVPLEVVFCSARRGWGTQDVLRYIQKALYP